MQITVASDRINALHTKLKADVITVEEIDELVDLLGMCSMTLTGEVPERFRNQTRH